MTRQPIDLQYGPKRQCFKLVDFVCFKLAVLENTTPGLACARCPTVSLKASLVWQKKSHLNQPAERLASSLPSPEYRVATMARVFGSQSRQSHGELSATFVPHAAVCDLKRDAGHSASAFCLITAVMSS